MTVGASRLTLAPGQRPIGTSIEANLPLPDDWFRSYDKKTRHDAEWASDRLLEAIDRAGQHIAPEQPRRRLTFDEQLALVASGRAPIIDLDEFGK